jgi:hypothetical protein
MSIVDLQQNAVSRLAAEAEAIGRLAQEEAPLPPQSRRSMLMIRTRFLGFFNGCSRLPTAS